MTEDELATAVRGLARTVITWPQATSPAYGQRATEVLTRLREAAAMGSGAIDHTDLRLRLRRLHIMTTHPSVPRDVQSVLRKIIQLAESVLYPEGAGEAEDTTAAIDRLRALTELPHMSATRVAADLLVKGDRTVRRWLTEGSIDGEAPSWLRRAEIIEVTPEYVITKVWRKAPASE